MKETETVGRWQYLCTQFNVIVIYIRLLFLPVHQNLDYLYPFKSGFFDAYTPFTFLFLIGLVAFGGWQIKKRPIISLGIFWFFVTLSVESSIIPIRDALFEHRLYLPMFGFSLIVSYLLFNFLSKKRFWAIIFFVVIIISFGAVTYQRNSVWQDGIKLWSDVVTKSPYNNRAHNNLGLTLYNQGRTEEAKDHYLEALRIKPDYVDALNNLGAALNKQGRLEEAIEHYLQALRIKPDYVNAHTHLGNALDKQGRTAEAIDHYLQALRIKPDDEQAHYTLGIALERQGRTAEAIDHYSQALRIKPDYVRACNKLGIALAKQGHIDESIDHFLKALLTHPDDAETHSNLGNALAKQGRIEEAIDHYLQALRIKPDYQKAHNNLGAAFLRKGNIKGAIDHFRKALQINPDYVTAKNNLKKALAIQRKNNSN